MTDLASVVKAWRRADPKHIHPTREHVSEQAYWGSGDGVGDEEVAVYCPGGFGDGRIATQRPRI